MCNITPAQLRKIHALSRELGLDRDMLHSYVEKLTKKESLKELTVSEAVKVIDGLSGKNEAAAGMMTGSQQKYMLGLVKEIGWTDEKGNPDMNRLQGFISERFKTNHINWLTSSKASQVIEALKAIKARQKKEE